MPLSRHASVKVNRPALKENFLNIKSRLYPHQQVMAIVKADAYGVG
ncbi:MAG: alanine racemase, partial [Spirochaetae bacterium HGW-Spirochaetae-6]